MGFVWRRGVWGVSRAWTIPRVTAGTVMLDGCVMPGCSVLLPPPPFSATRRLGCRCRCCTAVADVVVVHDWHRGCCGAAPSHVRQPNQGRAHRRRQHLCPGRHRGVQDLLHPVTVSRPLSVKPPIVIILCVAVPPSVTTDRRRQCTLHFSDRWWATSTHAKRRHTNDNDAHQYQHVFTYAP